MNNKVIALFLLCISLFLPVVASAETIEDSFYVGTWVYVARHGDDSGETITVLHLTDDHKTYFLIQSFYDDGTQGFGRTAVKTWSAVGDKIHVIIGENTSLDLRVKDQNTLQDDEYRPQDLYLRVGSISEEQFISKNLESGILLDPGQYIAGIDLPAGNYRFEFYKKPSDVYIRKNPDSALWSSYASVSKDSPVYAKINIPEGARVDIGPYPIIIMYAKPLKLGDQ